MNMILEKLEKFNIIGKDSKRVGVGVILVSMGLPLLMATSLLLEFSPYELAEADFLEWLFFFVIFLLCLLLPSTIVWSIHTCTNKGVRRILSLISISVIAWLFLELSASLDLFDGHIASWVILFIVLGIGFVLPWLLCKLLHWVISGFKDS